MASKIVNILHSTACWMRQRLSGALFFTLADTPHGLDLLHCIEDACILRCRAVVLHQFPHRGDLHQGERHHGVTL